MTFTLRTKMLSDDGDTTQTVTFWAPDNGGHVYRTSEGRPGTLGQQMCERLETMGNAIDAAPGGLATVIRRELRRHRDQERRFAARDARR